VDEARKQAEEQAKKAADEAAAKVKEAEAQAEKAKAEAEKAKAEIEKARAAAEEERIRLEEKALREALTKDLAEFTAEFAGFKATLDAGQEAWKEDEAKSAAIADVTKEFAALEAERAAVDGLMVQGKLAEARTKLEVLKAKYPPVKEKAELLLAEKPVPTEKWENMLKILAEETCLMKKNMPAQEFQKEREAVFTKYGMERPEYEELRAKYNKAPKPEDQARLGRLVSEQCPNELKAVKEEKVEELKEGAVEEKKPAAPAGPSGTYSGVLSGAGKKGSIKFVVKSGKLKSAAAVIGGNKIGLKGAFGKTLKLNGNAGGHHLRCEGKVHNVKITGTCKGTFEKKKFKNARFTAVRKK